MRVYMVDTLKGQFYMTYDSIAVRSGSSSARSWSCDICSRLIRIISQRDWDALQCFWKNTHQTWTYQEEKDWHYYYNQWYIHWNYVIEQEKIPKKTGQINEIIIDLQYYTPISPLKPLIHRLTSSDCEASIIATNFWQSCCSFSHWNKTYSI